MSTGFSKLELSNFLDVFCQLVIKAGKASLVHYQNSELEVQSKVDKSPLTAADLEANEIICTGLEAAYPMTPIVTEECAESQKLSPGSKTYFLIDPLDGTKEFVLRRGEFTINIALINNFIPIAGAVYVPVSGRLFLGAEGFGSFEVIDGKRVRLDPKAADQQNLRAMASRSHMSIEAAKFLRKNNIQEWVSAGSSLKFCLLAAGEADLYPRHGPTMEWDTAAGHAILAASGGSVKALDGESLLYSKPEFRNPHFIASRQAVEYEV